MAMKKFSEGEGKLEVLRGLEAEALNDNFKRTGKTKVSDFSKDEITQLEDDLTAARKREEQEGDPED